MSIDPGHFQLYPHLDPPLAAGTYRFTASQPLTGTGPDGEDLDADDLGVQSERLHVEITSPRYLLAPDQVLSTFPPAQSQGAWGSRLPQVVIKRRTLPWERDVAEDSTTPWLALVVFTQGEAEIRSAQPVAECVTPGLVLDGKADVATANYLAISKPMIDTILPTRKDVPLLAHARQVDINDTELMMGDDDGFLAVVIANRLPLAARDASGAEVPTTYTAALVSLEGQFDQLRPDSPPRSRFSDVLLAQVEQTTVAYADYDHISMGTQVMPTHGLSPAVLDGGLAPRAATTPRAVLDDRPTTRVSTESAAAAAYAKGGWAGSERVTRDKSYRARVVQVMQERRFPVLLHWDFTTTGSRTFRSLMTDLDSGLLGTVPAEPSAPGGLAGASAGAGAEASRPPLEVVETGHVGLTHRTRSGEQTRTWYRGPLLPHPADDRSPRLPLAHASDQLRSYVPDGREDVSLAAAFEIGRLLALNSPSMVATLLRWRRTRYLAARASTVWSGLLRDRLRFDDDTTVLQQDIGYLLGQTLVADIADDPDAVLGGSMSIFRKGEVPTLGSDIDQVLATGFGVDLDLRGDLERVLVSVKERQPLLVPPGSLSPREVTGMLRGSLDPSLVADLELRVRDTLTAADQPVMRPGGIFAADPGGPAHLSLLLDDTRDLDVHDTAAHDTAAHEAEEQP